jgi:hypothetical protein
MADGYSLCSAYPEDSLLNLHGSLLGSFLFCIFTLLSLLPRTKNLDPERREGDFYDMFYFLYQILKTQEQNTWD